ncbi:MAG: flagellar protein FliS [Pseudomonadota bacterium]
MARYATALGRNPEATYRQIDAAGRTGEADGHALVELLYDEVVRALRAAGWAAANYNYPVRSEKVSRSLAILFALESGLDFDRGGDVAKTLARLYAGARDQVIDASLGHDAEPFDTIAATLEEIGAVWASLKVA